MTKLNTCPNCGSEPELNVGYQESWVICRSCGVTVAVGATSDDTAIKAWNDVTANFTQPIKTLRDEFAMAAYIDKPMIATILKENGVEDFSYQDFAELEARMRYVFADAMLKERNK